ncbi:MinD/ParA family protein [Bacillus timonensis]|nr:MinD/ParA family protein [Bacillus timonensis]
MIDQAENLRNLLESKKNGEKEAKTIAVISGKGGVGKSNISLNFSIALSKRGHKVLLFDMDIGMGNIDILLGASSNKTIVDLFDPDTSIIDLIKKGPENLSYIAGGTGLSHLFRLDEEKSKYFVEQLKSIMHSYDFIIFDMGAGISEESLQFLLTVDEIFVVTTPEPTSITDAYSAMKYISSTEKSIPFYLIINRVKSEKEGIATINRLQHAVRQFLHLDSIQLGMLADDKNVSSAVNHQTPFILYAPKSMVSKSLDEMTNRYVTERNMESLNTGSFITKLRKLFVLK